MPQSTIPRDHLTDAQCSPLQTEVDALTLAIDQQRHVARMFQRTMELMADQEDARSYLDDMVEGLAVVAGQMDMRLAEIQNRIGATASSGMREKGVRGDYPA